MSRDAESVHPAAACDEPRLPQARLPIQDPRMSDGLPRLSRPEMREREEIEARLGRELSEMAGSSFTVRLTRNRKRLLSLRKNRAGKRELRMHEALAVVGSAEMQVLAAWVRDEPGSHGAAKTLLSRHASEIDRISALRAKAPPTSLSVGKHHDLLEILHEIRSALFPDLPPVYIAWSGRLGAARRRRLGSWTHRGRLIRIHVALDSQHVPRYFVASVVHHELCHAAIDPPRTPSGRRRVHGPEFRALETLFPDLERAQEWERRNVNRLLR